ncbi:MULTISPECIES: nuclease-related domain-containing protein [unclassified Peribacillus]|uniref:nuclease-related domain-containing protein n=1 Tax=unclassified Peribacillus TaxID=2675266 RepID=UPI001912FBFB|nr:MULTISPECIES: nuclease-related domain-containing protein [unclassified Peribacillus]MBK5442738.1 NERD domain-containing protein [Peribacillus sp. TH24]MBK5462520.1 NERD domain-containing protein [Peribacillus sp. TH27]MBK5500674.1 NERD domain-containing protein [Peribacillus sp. TH14]
MKKPCEKPMKMLKLEALSRRLSPNHPKQKKITNDYRKIRTGFYGESSIGKELKDLSKKYQVFHDLRLSRDESSFFQMDFLIVSTNCCIIIEVKNFAGLLYFDRTYPQLIRTKDGQEQAYLDPIIQVDVQKSRLINWLNLHKFPLLPIETLIANANSNTIIKTTPGHASIFKQITGKETLISKIQTLEKKYPSAQLTQRQRNKLSNTFLQKNTPHNPDILKWYQISETDLLKSVHCPECSILQMQRHWGKWICAHCSYSSKDAHIQTLRDYALLIRPKITNKQARLFLQIESIDIMQRILSTMELPYTGQYKNREYNLDCLFHE